MKSDIGLPLGPRADETRHDSRQGRRRYQLLKPMPNAEAHYPKPASLALPRAQE
jgi:hypothetical protein